MASALSFAPKLPQDDFSRAWADEPLGMVLKDADIPFALPRADSDLSFVLKVGDTAVGHCSAIRAKEYWGHFNKLDVSGQNRATQTCVRIHAIAFAEEQAFLRSINESPERALYNTGIAVLPEYRGHGYGLTMEERQIALCREKKMTTLFAETTNCRSAGIMAWLNFTQIAQYPYQQLASPEGLDYPGLAKIDDCVTVWCKRVQDTL